MKSIEKEDVERDLQPILGLLKDAIISGCREYLTEPNQHRHEARTRANAKRDNIVDNVRKKFENSQGCRFYERNQLLLLIYMEKYAIKFKKFNSGFMVSTPITQQSFDFNEQKEFDAIPAYFIKLNAGYCEDKMNPGEFSAYIACLNKECNHFVMNLGESLNDISSSPIEHLAPDPTPVESNKKSSGRIREKQKEKTKRVSNV